MTSSLPNDNESHYVETLDNYDATQPSGLLSERVGEIVGRDHILTMIAHQFETNLQQRDDVLIAMASRNGIYIPPVRYGDERGYYNAPDGQYVVREYTSRIMESAISCRQLGAVSSQLERWTNMTVDDVREAVAPLGIEVEDEEDPYYIDRLSLYLQLLKLGRSQL